MYKEMSQDALNSYFDIAGEVVETKIDSDQEFMISTMLNADLEMRTAPVY